MGDFGLSQLNQLEKNDKGGTVRCVAVRCDALRCRAMRCIVLFCNALRCAAMVGAGNRPRLIHFYGG